MAYISKIKVDGTAYDLKVQTMTGASDTANGTVGSVPAPIAGDNVKFLRGDGSWGEYAPVVQTLTLAVADWNEYSQSVTALGVTPDNTVIISVAPEDVNEYLESEVYCSVQGINFLTFSCGVTPTTALSINAVIFTNNDGTGSPASPSSVEWITF